MAKNNLISEHAIVDPAAKLANGVQVGPWSYIGPNVEVGENTIIGSHVVIKGTTKIGEENKFYQFSSIGEDCQDLKYKGEETYLEIGDRNVFREFVSVHRGTSQDSSLTKIGNDNNLLTYSHVAHDCILGNNIILGHNVGLAGHVKVDDYAILSGYVAVHQFCHVGAHSFMGGGMMLVKDLPPYILSAMVDGNPKAISVNSEGLKRRGFTEENILNIKRAYKILYRQGLVLEDALVKLKELASQAPEIELFIEFAKKSTRGIMR